ncbi:POT family-domain-containing protein [Phakopsora pachyrhizi]|nr:POT family-domain-containing protein [Phakopsora pachyrhizi]
MIQLVGSSDTTPRAINNKPFRRSSECSSSGKSANSSHISDPNSSVHPAASKDSDLNNLEEQHDHQLDEGAISSNEFNGEGNTSRRFPTNEEFSKLKRVPGNINLATYLICFIELVERFSYYGTTVVFTNFIQRPLPAGSVTGAGGVQSGALGKGQQAATGLTTFNSFWVYICPLFGAYVADAHLGRYNTVFVSVFIAIVGHCLLVISAVPTVIVNPDKSLAVFVVAIIIMGIGTGGFKPNISPLVAEQTEKLNGNKPFVKLIKIKDRKTRYEEEQKVIVDPSLTAARVFMYFYLLINVGALVGQIGMAYAEKYTGFWLAYLLPTLLLFICPFVMILGKPIYVMRPPTGSVFAQSMRLFKLAIQKKLKGYKNFLNNLSSTKLGFWEAVKPSHLGSEKPSWMKFDDQWVDEVRRGFKACKVFLWFPLYWVTYNQMSNNMTSQAAVLNTHGLPNDVISNLDPLTLIIFIPLFDMVIYPALRNLGINFTPIKKIAAGFLLGSLSMVCATITQVYIYNHSKCGNRAGDPECEVVDMSVWIQTPAYVLLATSEIFASITGLEYAFTLAPKNMRSLVTAVFLFQSAIGSAIGEAFNPLSADPLLVWNYGTMAVISFLAGIGFYLTNLKTDQEHDKLIRINEGKIIGEKGFVEEAEVDGSVGK